MDSIEPIIGPGEGIYRVYCYKVLRYLCFYFIDSELILIMQLVLEIIFIVLIPEPFKTMSAHLTDQDCINALATFWYEYHSQPRNERPGQALERAYLIAPEEVSIKKDYFERMEDFRLRASNQIEAYTPEYKALAPCPVVFNILLRENERSLQALYSDDWKQPIKDRMWYNEYEFKKSSTVTMWLSDRDPKGLMMVWQMLRGWEYQSCEHHEFRNSVAYQIKQQIEYGILETLKKIHCPDDKDRVWTSWEDPQLDSHVVCISDMF